MSILAAPLVRVVLACGTLTLAACTAEPPVAETTRTVLSRVVQPVAGANGMSVYAGEVRARHENDVAFRIAGKILSRQVEVGSLVKRGQTLARLDPLDVQLQAESARAQVAAAEAELVWARAEHERYRALHERRFVSQTVLEQKLHALATAEARLRQMQAQQSVSINQSTYATLVAESDGVVTALSMEPGQVVAAGQAVLRIARPHEKEVLINVPEGRVEELRKAKQLAVALWTDPQRRYAGVVREIAPNADPTTRTFATRVSIVAADERVRLGVTASVALPGDAPATAFMVPLTAIGDRAGRPVVWIVDREASTVAPRPVEVTAWREDGALVTAGVSAGERIVIVGVQKLREGEKVRLASATEDKAFLGDGSRVAARAADAARDPAVSR